MFNKIFIEKKAVIYAAAQNILAKLNYPEFELIEKVEDYFGRVKKPYLHKRTDLNLFIGIKEGELVKPAPPAYGYANVPHYYFIHSYNCIFECQYCYLQGYFNSPDIVMFINHEQICEEIIKTTTQKHSKAKQVWFHAGEFSDSLALSGLQDEWEIYWQTFKELPTAYLELRTKSVNTRKLFDLEPIRNIVITFSLSSKQAITIFDLKTPPLQARLRAIKKLADYGYKIGIHLDPIVYHENTVAEYQELLSQLIEVLPPDKLEYMSLGVVRFAKKSYHQVKQNYPDTKLFSSEFIHSFDGKIRYPRPLRQALLNKIKAMAMEVGYTEEIIYLCMEEELES